MTDSPAYSTLRSVTDLSLATSTLLPAYSSSPEPSNPSSRSETSSWWSSSDQSKSPSLPGELRTNIEHNEVLDSTQVPPAKPPRLFKNKKKISSPEIEEEEEDSLYFQILCRGRDTEVGLSSPNYRAPPVIVPSPAYLPPGDTER